MARKIALELARVDRRCEQRHEQTTVRRTTSLGRHLLDGRADAVALDVAPREGRADLARPDRFTHDDLGAQHERTANRDLGDVDHVRRRDRA